MLTTDFATDIELKFRNGLIEKGYRGGIDFCTEFPLKNSYILDIYFPDKKVAVELDGEPWHTSEKARKRDAHKNKICEQKGIHLLRFWGKEIYENCDDCINKVLFLIE